MAKDSNEFQSRERITQNMDDRKYQEYGTYQKKIKFKIDNLYKIYNKIAPRVGLEPTT